MLICTGIRGGGGPYRYGGGNSALAIERNRFAPAALALGFNLSEATQAAGESVSNIHGIPSGSVRGWVMPVKGGAVKSYKRTDIEINGVAVAELGYPATGTTTITLDGSAVGGLIVGATGSATISIDGTAAILAVLNATGSATISIDGSAALGALASLTGTATLSIDGHSSIMALGYMTGSTIETGELTPAGIAAAVWNALLAAHTADGSAGNALGLASSGGVDYAALAAAILAAAQLTPIHADARQINGETLIGDGRTTEFHT